MHAGDPALALTALVAALGPEALPLVRLPGGTELQAPSGGQVWRALGIGAELGAREEVDLVVVGGGPAGLGAAVYGASEGLDTVIIESTVLGGQAAVSRRIENYLGFPAGISVFYAAGPPEAQRCGATRVAVVGGGNSAAQAAIWLSRGGALVTLLHRRADLRETMSDYLIGDLERHGIAVRDRSEITALHGSDGQLEGVTLSDGERLPLSYLFLFLGASPCTEWLGAAVARDDKGFVLTGADAGAAEALETSVPGVYAAGDVRSGSPKRCATAVGEGAAVVRLVHQRLTSVPA